MGCGGGGEGALGGGGGFCGPGHASLIVRTVSVRCKTTLEREQKSEIEWTVSLNWKEKENRGEIGVW